MHDDTVKHRIQLKSPALVVLFVLVTTVSSLRRYGSDRLPSPAAASRCKPLQLSCCNIASRHQSSHGQETHRNMFVIKETRVSASSIPLDRFVLDVGSKHGRSSRSSITPSGNNLGGDAPSGGVYSGSHTSLRYLICCNSTTDRLTANSFNSFNFVKL
jgi:hypothetical protein